MFRIDTNPTKWFQVTVSPLFDDSGRSRSFNFDAEFNVLGKDELQEFLKSGSGTNGVPNDDEIIERVFVRWRKVEDSNGQPLDVTPDNRKRLLNIIPVSASIVRAWLESVGFKGREGN